MPAGFPVLLLTGAATRDERAFENPDAFDIERAPGISIGFGHGTHSCLGAALARMESRVALEELASRWPRFEVDFDGLRRVHMSNVAGYSNVPVRVPSRSRSPVGKHPPQAALLPGEDLMPGRGSERVVRDGA